jgi:hypothetical protein
LHSRQLEEKENACFFLLISEDVSGLKDFTIDAFVDFYLQNKT